MCGLAGVVLLPRRRSPAELSEIWGHFTRMLLLAQRRGVHASGACVLRADGRYALVRRPVPARDLVQSAPYVRLGQQIDGSVVTIFGHARHVTKGEPENPVNNHPIDVAPAPGVHAGAVGVHNGTIDNDDQLFGRYGYARRGQVDSEIIFHLMAEAFFWPQNRRRFLFDHLSDLEGTLSFLCWPRGAPSTLLVYRGTEPLCRRFDRSRGTWYFASIPSQLAGTFGTRDDIELLPSRHLYTYQVLDGGDYREDSLALPPVAHGLGAPEPPALPSLTGEGCWDLERITGRSAETALCGLSRGHGGAEPQEADSVPPADSSSAERRSRA